MTSDIHLKIVFYDFRRSRSQLVVLHEQAMTWLGRAIRVERIDFANTYLNGASKLLTSHHENLTSLLKYRRGGEQRVHIEHVHVNVSESRSGTVVDMIERFIEKWLQKRLLCFQ